MSDPHVHVEVAYTYTCLFILVFCSNRGWGQARKEGRQDGRKQLEGTIMGEGRERIALGKVRFSQTDGKTDGARNNNKERDRAETERENTKSHPCSQTSAQVYLPQRQQAATGGL